MRAVCYARVSSAIQRDRDTIASQLRVLPAFIERQGWTLAKPVETYIDDGRTAKAGHLEARTGLAALLRDAVLGHFDVVVVVDVDRLTRAEDLTERGAILGALQRAGVKLASATSGQVLDLSTSTGDLFTTLHAFFAAEWTRKHRERVTQGKITAIQRNRKPAGRAPYGLGYDKAKGEWFLDPVKAPIIRELYERVAAGESCRQISDDFHRRGLPKFRTEWNRSRAQRIVRSRYAIGTWVADKTRGLAVAVPPIIDEDLWHRAQQAMDKSGMRGLRKTKHDYLLEGLGVCGSCGAPIGIRTAKFDPRRRGTWSRSAYQCRSRRYFRVGDTHCGAPCIPVAEADARAWESIRAELDDPALAERIIGEIAGRQDEATQWQKDLAGYRDHLARLERVEENVLERYRRGIVSDGAFDTELKKIARERDAVKAQIATAEKARDQLGDVAGRLEDAQRTLEQLRSELANADFATRRALIELLVPEGGVVFDGTRMKITLLVPRTSGGRLVERPAYSTPHENYLRVRVVA